MEVRAGSLAGHADEGDGITSGDRLTSLDQQFGAMGVESRQTGRMFNNDVVTVAVMAASGRDDPISGGINFSSLSGGVIIAIMEVKFSGDRVVTPAEAIGQPAAGERVDQRAVKPVRREAHSRRGGHRGEILRVRRIGRQRAAAIPQGIFSGSEPNPPCSNEDSESGGANPEQFHFLILHPSKGKLELKEYIQ